jgi:acylphosphatase
MVEIECVVTGKVQGVGYRDYVARAAGDCEINGFAANQSDGTVLVVGQGTHAHLKDFIEYLHEGSVMAEVAEVKVTWRDAEKKYDDFSITR